MSLHGPRTSSRVPIVMAPPTAGSNSRTAAVQALLEHYTKDGQQESERVARAWALYDTPEVRFATRQYANAFASAKLMLARREVLWEDPKPILEPSSREEHKAFELLQSFAGGPVGQVELLDRIGTYFVVSGDMAMVGAYDPANMRNSKFAKWDVWSTTEVRWDGQNIRIREHATEDVWQQLPDYIRHFRMWNRHPRRGWESDSPVLSSLKVLELVGLYDERLQAEALSRLIGAGVWMIPQGMQLPSSNGQPGSPEDFLKLMMEVASIAIKDRTSPAANVPILIEAAAEDIEAASKGRIDFHTDFAQSIGDLQEKAIRRWGTGVDLPAETLLGLSSATHWNATLISEYKNQSFIIPALRRVVGNFTSGWLHPAMAQVQLVDPSIEVWFDPSGIKTRVDTADEAQWAHERGLIGDEATKYHIGLGHIPAPTNDELKRQLLIHMALQQPEFVPAVLTELGIPNNMPSLTDWQAVRTSLNQSPQRFAGPNSLATDPGGDRVVPAAPAPAVGRQGPQAKQETAPPPVAPGRSATVSTKEKK